MKEEAYSPMLFQELADALNIEESKLDELKETLEHMEAEGLIVKTRKEKIWLT